MELAMLDLRADFLKQLNHLYHALGILFAR